MVRLLVLCLLILGVMFSGPGIQIAGQNLLFGVDAQLDAPGGVLAGADSMSEMIDAFAPSAATKILMLDACRDNPLGDAATRSITSIPPGLAWLSAPTQDLLVLYAAQPDHLALDGIGQNGPLTEAVAPALIRVGDTEICPTGAGLQVRGPDLDQSVSCLAMRDPIDRAPAFAMTGSVGARTSFGSMWIWKTPRGGGNRCRAGQCGSLLGVQGMAHLPMTPRVGCPARRCVLAQRPAYPLATRPPAHEERHRTSRSAQELSRPGPGGRERGASRD